MAGAILLSMAMALPWPVPAFTWILGVGAIIGGLLFHAICLLDQIGRRLLGLPARNRSLFAESTHDYVCPKCGYSLRGLHGTFCPECGEVRPAPIDGEMDE